jgi:hypothetical protein
MSIDVVGGNLIALGTKQYLLVNVVDLADQITDLSTHSPKYTVMDDANNFGYNAQAAVATLMTVYCLIDTTVDPAGAFTWLSDTHYRLWVGFTLAPEAPFIGPFDFYLT